MKYFTSDTHFGSDSNIIERESRPFKSMQEYTSVQLDIWNKTATKGDKIYMLGDFCSFNNTCKNWESGMKVVKNILAPVLLVVGNNEERVISKCFNGNLAAFKEYCKKLGFADVSLDKYISIGARKFYLNHYPKNHKEEVINLFGHTHRATGLWKPYGLNVGTDNNHFRLFSEADILDLVKAKEDWWDSDENNLSM